MATQVKIEDSIRRAYLSAEVDRDELSKFITVLTVYLHELDQNKDEEYNKKLIDRFLSAAFYEGRHAINTNASADLAIFADAKAKGSHPVVLFEVKGVNSSEMVKPGQLNKKALHELVLYYLREEIAARNTDIKHLIITDGWHWFIFDKQNFYDCFASRKAFSDSVLKADQEGNKTKYIYDQVIRPETAAVEGKLRYTYADLTELRGVKEERLLKSKKLKGIYKLFSPTHLLKQPFLTDHNQLNTGFYYELLHIMGLEEVMVDNIARIRRCREQGRQPHSLMEETISLLDEIGTIHSEEEREDAALGLVLTWVNRLLFLKLLEAQLVSFNEDKNRKFLLPHRVPNYRALNDLFIQVLAKPVETRIMEMKDQFEDVPYLNSSLFEYTPLELRHVRVRELRSGRMTVMKNTRIHDDDHHRIKGELPTLEYLLRFLDAYDFSGAPIQHDKEEEDSTIINAAVLGNIFEKINGYKDGAFFTPSYISEFISRETIRRIVVDKLNTAKGWTYPDFDTLKDEVHFTRQMRQEANAIINSIRICDPSVGSGHFLVAALNELIAIKSELGILEYHDDEHSKIKDYDVTVIDDELVIRNDESIFKYKRGDRSSYLLQRALFEEKRILIENCLFGVDINPKSVEICRLRLWIELLKSSYYEQGELRVLPNIDINIKCGNALVSKYPVRVGKGVIDNEKRELLQEYRQLVSRYKSCRDKAIKRQISESIHKLCTGEMVLDIQQRNLFNVSDNVINSVLDWSLVFPEVLNEQGQFTGFDAVIGNPPYISLQSMPEMSELYGKLRYLNRDNYRVPLYKTYSSTGDIYNLFFERALHILKPKGYLCFVTSNKWLRSNYGTSTRSMFTSEANPLLLVDFPGQKLFSKATVEVCILLASQESYKGQLQACSLVRKEDDLWKYVHSHLTTCSFVGTGDWVVRTREDQAILKKVSEKSKLLGEWGNKINRGILTGRNEVFIIDITTRERILAACQDEEEKDRTEALMRPIVKGRDLSRYHINYDNRWLLHIHNGIPGSTPPVDINDYPAVKAYLDKHWEKIRDRSDQGQTPYNLRNCAYWPEFNQPKIIWGDLADIPKFCFDEKGTYYGDNTTYWMTGDHLIYLLCHLNSPLSSYLFKKLGNTTGAGTIRWQKYKIEQQLVPCISTEAEERIIDCYRRYTESGDKKHLDEAYRVIYDHLGLTEEETRHINQES